MSMIVNYDRESGQLDVNHQLPDRDHFKEVADALEHNEKTVDVLQDDPMGWYSLLFAVGNYLYQLPPEAIGEDFLLSQLAGHFASIVGDVHEQYCDDDGDDDEPDDDEATAS